MRRFSAFFILPVLALPAFFFFQDAPGQTPANLEITGVNAADAPEVTVTVDVTDAVGQTVTGLTIDNFHLGGPLAGIAQIVNVERVTEDNLPFAIVLVIDTSSSMADMPLARTKAAAKAFVNALGPEDTVAIVTFSSDPFILREFTTDKADLIAAIDGLGFGGQTALYDAATTGIELAAEAPYPRRAVILLSDGAEYGGASLTDRADAAALSPVRGVPVYTIGLGFGLDRTYLQQLSDASSARFYESPTPEELAAIYADLADLFRSQYVLTLNYDGALDGTIYPFTLRASSSTGDSNVDAATVRAPIPIPIVSVSPEPTAPLAAPVTFTASAVADQEVASIEFALDGETSSDDEAPFTFDFDPFFAAPGDHTLTVRATDADGDTGETSLTFAVAAIPSRISLDTDLGFFDQISQPITVTVSAESQTAPQLVELRIDGENVDSAETLPAQFTVNPFELAPGPHTVEFVVTDESGAQAAITQTANIAALAPVISVDSSALTDPLTEVAAIAVQAAGQTPIESISFTLNGEVATIRSDSAQFTVDPITLAPGAQSVTVIATDQAGTAGAAQVPFNVGVLPPIVTVEGIAEGNVLDAPRDVSITIDGQTTQGFVSLVVDGNIIETDADAPYGFIIDPTSFGASGEYVVGIVTMNEFQAADNKLFNVTVPDSVFPTPTPTPTETPDASQTAAADSLIQQATIDALATADAGATAQAEATNNAQATSNAQSTADAEAAAAAQATADAQATVDTQSALDAQSTADAVATAEEQALRADATMNAEATAAARETERAEASADAQATSNAVLTLTARANATIQRQATAEARQTQQAQSTLDAQLTEIAQQTLVALETVNAQATMDTTRAVETQEAATMAAETAAARDLQRTAVARQTAEAQLTEDAQGRATTQAEMALVRQSTADAVSTREAVQSAATDTAATAQVEGALTAVAQAEETMAALTESAPTATETVEPSATPEPSATDEPTNVPTEEPTATSSLEPTVEATVVEPTATVFDPTSTPGSPTDVIAQGADAPDSQVALLAVAAGIILLFVIIALISMARRNRK